MRREVSQTWRGHGKENCLKAIEQAEHWIYSKRPGKLYDNGYTTRWMHYHFIEHDMEHWCNDGKHGQLCDFIDKLYVQIENMGKDDYFYISVTFVKGSWF